MLDRNNDEVNDGISFESIRIGLASPEKNQRMVER